MALPRISWRKKLRALRGVKGGPNPRRIAVGQNPALSIGHRQIDNAVLSGGVLHQGLEIICPSSVHAPPDTGACFQSSDKGVSEFQKVLDHMLFLTMHVSHREHGHGKP